jgi:hypothetical protein
MRATCVVRLCAIVKLIAILIDARRLFVLEIDGRNAKLGERV